MGGQADQNRALQSNFGQWSKNGAANMVMTSSDAKALFNTDGVLEAPESWKVANPKDKNTTWTVGSVLRNGYDFSRMGYDAATAAKSAAANIENKVDDLAHEVAAIKELLTGFKAPSVTIDPEAVKAALDGALKEIQYTVSPKAGV